MIRGLSTGRRSWDGRGGIRIRASGLAGRTCRLGSASASDFSRDLVGAGTTGAATGTTTSWHTTTCATTRTVRLSITATFTTAVAVADRKRSAVARGLPQQALQRTETFTTDRALRPGPLREITTRRGAMPNLADRATCARARSATTITAARQEATPRGAARALVAAVSMVAAEATA